MHVLSDYLEMVFSSYSLVIQAGLRPEPTPIVLTQSRQDTKDNVFGWYSPPWLRVRLSCVDGL
jgi:hypothetical protein